MISLHNRANQATSVYPANGSGWRRFAPCRSLSDEYRPAEASGEPMIGAHRAYEQVF